MRGSDNRLPLLTAIFVALLLAAVPGSVQAQMSFPQTGLASANNCSGMTGVQLCQCQMNNGHIKRAQDLTVNHLKVFSNASIIDMKLVYCWNSIILPALQTIGALTSGANGQNPFGAIIWALVNNILIGIINQACQIAASAVQQAISFIKSLVCIPIPHFNLSLGGGFHGGTCNGISLFNLLGTGVTRPTTPSSWQLWNYSSPGMSP